MKVAGSLAAWIGPWKEVRMEEVQLELRSKGLDQVKEISLLYVSKGEELRLTLEVPRYTWVHTYLVCYTSVPR